MKIIFKNVYYCDFCKKKGLSSGAIKKHETRCTGNPNRECGLCENKTGLTVAVEAYKSRFVLSENKNLSNENMFSEGNLEEKIVTWTGLPITLAEIEDQYDYCPACTLAILRLTGLNRHYFHFDFDYKKGFNRAIAERKQKEIDSLEDYYP